MANSQGTTTKEEEEEDTCQTPRALRQKSAVANSRKLLPHKVLCHKVIRHKGIRGLVTAVWKGKGEGKGC